MDVTEGVETNERLAYGGKRVREMMDGGEGVNLTSKKTCFTVDNSGWHEVQSAVEQTLLAQ